jgi:cell division protease FtsH
LNIKAIARRTTWKFWMKLAVVAAAIFGIDYGIVSALGGTFDDAMNGIPSLLLTALMFVAQMIALMLANFMLFFGPFLGYAMMGLNVTEPGDATWDVKVSDVRGQKAAVGEMRKILNLIEKGKQFVLKGGTREKGVLMAGPPGTGKTMLAKAIASELRMPILATSGAGFAGMFFGMDVLKVLIMSARAKRLAKKWGGCIVFIDELDAIGQRRNQGGQGAFGGMFMGGGSMALNMMLVVMDGLDSAGFVKKFLRKRINNILNALFIPFQIKPLKPPTYNVFFMAATNRPEVLDEAITRPGRFGRRISFKIPDKAGRLDILDLYLSRIAHDSFFDDGDVRAEVASITEGFSPASIQQALNMALMYALEHEREEFTWPDLIEALASVQVGTVEPIEFHEDDALSVARHEMGHALALKLFVPHQMATRLSIRPRGDSLGHLQPADKREEFVRNKNKHSGFIKVALASTATERMFYSVNTSGVSGDLAAATQTATLMVSQWGMGDVLPKTPSGVEKLGETLIALPPDPNNPVRQLLGDERVRRGVARILGQNYLTVERAVKANREGLDRLARQLVIKKELVGHEIDDLFEQEKWNA